MSDIDDCRKSVERLTRDRGEVMREGNDKIEEIRARHEDNASIGSIIHGPDRPPSWTLVGWKAHHDRAFLLLELDRLRAENERLSEALREALSGLRYRRRKKK